MRLILLPAFDGTGLMFTAFVNELDNAFETTVISYPESGPQDYSTLTDTIRKQIPQDEDFIVLGESFAGPIVYQVAIRDTEKCKGAIFVATYLTNPNPLILKILTAMPPSLISFLVSRPFVVKAVFLSREADDQIANAIAANFSSVNRHAIRQRLMVIGNLGTAPTQEIAIPCLCIQATKDSLVPESKVIDLKRVCRSLEVRKVEGGHFILQQAPKDAADVVRAFGQNLRVKQEDL
ncbi:MAG: alpha/beta fold hydrolase [Gammaproteobacteria bacterium]